MVEADLRGSDTHGVIRLPLYVRRIRAGGVNTKPDIRVVSDRPSAALIDGDNGMGHLVMRRAAEIAIEKAKATGIGWVGARMSNHAGPAALYVTMPLKHDMIGLYFAVGSSNHLPPWGGSESLLGTNPMAVAVPAMDEPPIVLDMSPTVAAYGKVRLKAQRGEAMPVGWMIDREGKPLTDPKRADEGHLLPIGDYKGSGLSLIIGILAGALNRAALGREVIDFVKEAGKATNTGQAIAAIAIETFMPAADFKRAVDQVIRDIRNSRRLPGVERIWLPGEQSHAKLRIAARTACRCRKRCAKASTPWRATRRRAAGISHGQRTPRSDVVGLGLMGEVYDASPHRGGIYRHGLRHRSGKSERLAQIGARAGSLADIARDCDPIVLAVFNTDQVEDVVEHALLPAAAGKIVLCTSTCDPDRIAALGARVAGRLRFLETPVSGTSEQVRQGDGVGLIGGDERSRPMPQPVLDALFPKRFHIGKVGDGGRAKLAVNLILGLNRLALAEGLVFAARLGLDPAAFLKVARARPRPRRSWTPKARKWSAAILPRKAACARRSRTPTSCSTRRARSAKNCRFSKFMPMCWKPACATAKPTQDNSIIIEEIRRRIL